MLDVLPFLSVGANRFIFALLKINVTTVACKTLLKLQQQSGEHFK